MDRIEDSVHDLEICFLTINHGGRSMALSKRLKNFIENHLEIQEDGDSENGPDLDIMYVGPSWAEKAYMIDELGWDSFPYQFDLYHETQEVFWENGIF